jgi:predicted MFS family arabinose efflux permease
VSERKTPHLAVQLVGLTFARLFLNTGIRMVYPFLPALARGLGVPITAVYDLVIVRNLAGFLSPLFSPLSERFGRKPIIMGAMLLFSLGCFLVVLWPAYWPLGLTLCLIAIAKAIYDPAMQAYLGDTVPYGQRGRALSVTELSWAGALLVGAPAVGFTMQRWGWQTPFLWLGLAAMGTAALLGYALPRVGNRAGQVATLYDLLPVLRRHPVIWAAAVYVLLAMAANETFFIVYGDWMEESFSLTLTTLGLASGIIGGSEIIGELASGMLVDRLGKRPVVIVTGLFTAAMYYLLPYFSRNLSGALASLFALFLFFEITVVGAIPLLTEIVPGARSLVMSTVIAAAALGRALGTALGPAVWARGGLANNGLVAAVIMAAAMLILAGWVREADSMTRKEWAGKQVSE